MLTAIEIRNQKFKKSLNGYNCNEVDEFMDRLARDFESVYAEKNYSKEQIQNLNEQIERYQKIESTMNESIIVAKQAAELLKDNARREANLILEESKKKIAELLTIYQEVIKRLNLLNVEIKSQLQTELALLEKNERRVEELSDFFYSKDMKDLLEKLSSLAVDKVEYIGTDKNA